MKIKDIAAALSIGNSKVRKWKALDKWDEEMKGSAPRRGAPKGNKNSVGNRGGAPTGNKRTVGNKGGPGGPLRNKKAVTKGEYETIWMDAFEEDEQDLVDQVDTDPIQQAERFASLAKRLVVNALL